MTSKEWAELLEQTAEIHAQHATQDPMRALAAAGCLLASRLEHRKAESEGCPASTENPEPAKGKRK